MSETFEAKIERLRYLKDYYIPNAAQLAQTCLEDVQEEMKNYLEAQEKLDDFKKEFERLYQEIREYQLNSLGLLDKKKGCACGQC